VLPRSCHLTYDESSDPRVLQLIQQVPEELWGAKLALQVFVVFYVCFFYLLFLCLFFIFYLCVYLHL
jgi:hypothetical protein